MHHACTIIIEYMISLQMVIKEVHLEKERCEYKQFI